MKTTMTTRLVIALLATSLLAACGNGFDALGVGNTDQGSNNGQSDDGVTPAPNKPDPYENLDLGGDVNGGSYDREKIFELDKAKDALVLYVPLPVMGPFSHVYID